MLTTWGALSRWTQLVLAAIVGLLPLTISLGSFVYTMRTYTITHRPYIGITQVDYRPDTGAQGAIERLRWHIQVKNTGSLPGWMHVETHEVTVTMGAEVMPVPLPQPEPEARVFLMPGEVGILYGEFPDNASIPIRHVLAGQAVLRDKVRFVYEPSAAMWWKPQFYYEATLRFLAGPSRILSPRSGKRTEAPWLLSAAQVAIARREPGWINVDKF
jgi:hypothetical protein